MTINDNANILGRRSLVNPEKRKHYGTILWLARNYASQLYDLLVKHGYIPPDRNISSLVKGMVHMIKTNNQAFMKDAADLVRPASRFSHFDPGIITGAFAFLANLFKKEPREDISDELIELQKEKEKQAAMRNLIIFGGIAVLGVIGMVVIIRATK